MGLIVHGREGLKTRGRCPRCLRGCDCTEARREAGDLRLESCQFCSAHDMHLTLVAVIQSVESDQTVGELAARVWNRTIFSDVEIKVLPLTSTLSPLHTPIALDTSRGDWGKRMEHRRELESWSARPSL